MKTSRSIEWRWTTLLAASVDSSLLLEKRTPELSMFPGFCGRRRRRFAINQKKKKSQKKGNASAGETNISPSFAFDLSNRAELPPPELVSSLFLLLCDSGKTMMLRQVRLHPIYTSVSERFAGDLELAGRHVAVSFSRMDPYFRQPRLTAECRFLEHYITAYERHWK